MLKLWKINLVKRNSKHEAQSVGDTTKSRMLSADLKYKQRWSSGVLYKRTALTMHEVIARGLHTYMSLAAAGQLAHAKAGKRNLIHRPTAGFVLCFLQLNPTLF
jgi:hypothetical protein